MAVTQAEEDAIINRLVEINDATKTLDSFPEWELVPNRTNGKLYWVSALRLGGMLGGGVSVRFATPADAWETDVYGHIEVAVPSLGPRRLRINPAEWKPKSVHRNPVWAPEPHRLATYSDRWHPFEWNRSQGLIVFTQGGGGAASPLPPEVTTFSSYLHFCAYIWKCADIERVPPPPWSRRLV